MRRPRAIRGFDYRIPEAQASAAAALIEEAIRTGQLSSGVHSQRLEQALRVWVGGREVANVSNGTVALEAIFERVGVRDRAVLMPSNTFVATVNSVLRCGGRPVFVDIEPDGLGLCPEQAALAVEVFAPAAIVAVHVGGIISPRIAEIARLCQEQGIALVEDAAHAFGSTLAGRPAGTFGDFAAFSFFATKVLTTGEGGAISSADPESMAEIRRLRDHGRVQGSPEMFDMVGTNRRMSDLQALVGSVLLDGFSAQLETRRSLAARYDALLTALAPTLTPVMPSAVRSNYYKYIVRISGIDRGQLRRVLRERYSVELASEVYAIPCHRQPAHDSCDRFGPLTHTERFCDQHLCIPLYPSLDGEDQTWIVEALTEATSLLGAGVNAWDMA